MRRENRNEINVCFCLAVACFLCLRISVSRVLETLLRGMVALEPVMCCV